MFVIVQIVVCAIVIVEYSIAQTLSAHRPLASGLTVGPEPVGTTQLASQKET